MENREMERAYYGSQQSHRVAADPDCIRGYHIGDAWRHAPCCRHTGSFHYVGIAVPGAQWKHPVIFFDQTIFHNLLPIKMIYELLPNTCEISRLNCTVSPGADIFGPDKKNPLSNP